MSIRADGVLERPVFESAFRECGIPAAIRKINGVRFATQAIVDSPRVFASQCLVDTPGHRALAPSPLEVHKSRARTDAFIAR